MPESMKYRLLLVDDNEDAACSMAQILTLSGFEVKTCFDGPSALEAVKEFAPDACVLDIAMPVMDGYDLARQLRERLEGHQPVIATLTAYDDYNHLDRAVDAGFDLHFTKPVDPQDMIDQLIARIPQGTDYVSAPSELV